MSWIILILQFYTSFYVCSLVFHFEGRAQIDIFRNKLEAVLHLRKMK